MGLLWRAIPVSVRVGSARAKAFARKRVRSVRQARTTPQRTDATLLQPPRVARSPTSKRYGAEPERTAFPIPFT
jgi:hypothetical protein